MGAEAGVAGDGRAGREGRWRRLRQRLRRQRRRHGASPPLLERLRARREEIRRAGRAPDDDDGDGQRR